MASLAPAQGEIRRMRSFEQPGKYNLIDPYGNEMAGSGHAHRKGNDIVNLLGIMRDNIILSAMLVFVPVGIYADKNNWPESSIFLTNFFAIVPLAWMIGTATEELSGHTGETLGGLINATFGNIVEMMLCVAGIREGQLTLTQSTLIGSILSNLLLVMGCAFVCGGLLFKTQSFSQAGASVQSSMLVLSVLALAIPTMYGSQINDVHKATVILQLSRYTAVLLLGVYVLFLVFQLKTHAYLFEGDGGEAEEPALSACFSAMLLAGCTVVTSMCTEALIASIEGTISSLHLSKEFIGIIMLPIIGNAAEHYTAITVAMRNKMDLSLGVACGSSVQMALLVTPFTVIVGWIVDQPMDLNFHPFQLGVLAVSIFVVTSILNNGQSTWVEGVMLLIAYIIIGLVYFFESSGTSTYGPTMPIRRVPPPGTAPLGKMKVKVPLHAPNITHV